MMYAAGLFRVFQSCYWLPSVPFVPIFSLLGLEVRRRLARGRTGRVLKEFTRRLPRDAHKEHLYVYLSSIILVFIVEE